MISDQRHGRLANILIRRAIRWQAMRHPAQLTERDFAARAHMLEMTLQNLKDVNGRVSNGAVKNLIEMDAQGFLEPTEGRNTES